MQRYNVVAGFLSKADGGEWVKAEDAMSLEPMHDGLLMALATMRNRLLDAGLEESK